MIDGDPTRAAVARPGGGGVQDWDPVRRAPGCRAGVIKAAASYPLHPEERRCCARPRRRSARGRADHHPRRPARSALEIVDSCARRAPISRACSLGSPRPPGRADRDAPRVAESGCFLEFDLFGHESPTSANARDMPSDAQRLDVVGDLVARGLTPASSISQDICTKHRLVRYGGHGYRHVAERVALRLRERGFTADEVDAILVENPARALSFAPPERPRHHGPAEQRGHRRDGPDRPGAHRRAADRAGAARVDPRRAAAAGGAPAVPRSRPAVRRQRDTGADRAARAPDRGPRRAAPARRGVGDAALGGGAGGAVHHAGGSRVVDGAAGGAAALRRGRRRDQRRVRRDGARGGRARPGVLPPQRLPLPRDLLPPGRPAAPALDDVAAVRAVGPLHVPVARGGQPHRRVPRARADVPRRVLGPGRRGRAAVGARGARVDDDLRRTRVAQDPGPA